MYVRQRSIDIELISNQCGGAAFSSRSSSWLENWTPFLMQNPGKTRIGSSLTMYIGYLWNTTSIQHTPFIISYSQSPPQNTERITLLGIQFTKLRIYSWQRYFQSSPAYYTHRNTDKPQLKPTQIPGTDRRSSDVRWKDGDGVCTTKMKFELVLSVYFQSSPSYHTHRNTDKPQLKPTQIDIVQLWDPVWDGGTEMVLRTGLRNEICASVIHSNRPTKLNNSRPASRQYWLESAADRQASTSHHWPATLHSPWNFTLKLCLQSLPASSTHAWISTEPPHTSTERPILTFTIQPWESFLRTHTRVTSAPPHLCNRVCNAASSRGFSHSQSCRNWEIKDHCRRTERSRTTTVKALRNWGRSCCMHWAANSTPHEYLFNLCTGGDGWKVHEQYYKIDSFS